MVFMGGPGDSGPARGKRVAVPGDQRSTHIWSFSTLTWYRGRGLSAGPWRTFPVRGSKADPWHGHRIFPSRILPPASRHPLWVQMFPRAEYLPPTLATRNSFPDTWYPSIRSKRKSAVVATLVKVMGFPAGSSARRRGPGDYPALP